jgi:arsenate reductase (thioredoxin)
MTRLKEKSVTLNNKPKVLFLCTGNSARSQMAEAYLRHYAGDRYEVFSAGLNPQGINAHTVRVMEEAGVPLEGQWSKDVKEYLKRVNFGYLITVCHHAEKNCPRTFLGVSKRLHWELEDPAAFAGGEEETIARFRQVRDQIESKVRGWLADPDAGAS